MLKKLLTLAALALTVMPVYAQSTVFTVTSTADTAGSTCGSTCTLRQAITAASANPGSTITFNIAGNGVHVIYPLTPLPKLNTPMTIDGTTQPGYNGKPLIVIDGTFTQSQPPFNTSPPYIDLIGINMVGCTGCVVKGLNIRHFGYGGVGILNGGSNVVQGNYIGTDATGTAAAPNLYGVIITNATDNQIGGQTAGLGNLISGNTNDGVNIYGAGATGNRVEGNRIGTNAAGTALLGNQDKGIKIELSSNTLVSGNIIAGSGNTGVFIKAGGTGNNLVNNAIYSNTGLGIDLTASGQPSAGPDGPTANDAGDGDGGPNNLQNYPVLTSAWITTGSIAISGTLDSAASTDYQVQFFASPSCDPSGYGEGQIVLPARTVTTDGGGNAAFNVTLSVVVPNGQHITATATDPQGNTSEFSACIPAQAIDFTQSPARNYYDTTAVKLTWMKVSWAQSYEVQISANPAFPANASETHEITDGKLFYDWTAPPGDGNYYWRVRAKNALGVVSPWSAADSVVVDVP
jgi:CSLREA domain-containing protein